MNFLTRLFQKRNYAVSDMYQAQTAQPIYTDFTIQKAVKEGLKINVWVYRCVNLITQAAASVPWFVEKENEKIEGHAFSKLIDKPNPFISRQQMFELLVSWLQLAGNAYIKKVVVGGRTQELWPVSPDRLQPVPARNVDEWLDGYALDTNDNIAFEPDEIIHLTAIQDPANPLIGLSPLQAAGKIIDVDNAQQTFNTSAMQNQGTASGVWTFERSFANQAESDAISEKLNEIYAGISNAKRMIVLGSNAKFQSTSMTPQELDFLESRKTNRNEIFLAFGIPPAYGGSEEASTYNNFQASELIFWNQTILPLLNDIRDIFNHSFQSELGENEKITYDLSNVTALQNALYEKAKTAETLSKIGVPFEQLNSKFEFGFTEFAGWDESVKRQQQPTAEAPDDRGKPRLTLDTRAKKDISEDLEKAATENLKSFHTFFDSQKKKIFADLDKNKGSNMRTIINAGSDELKEIMLTAYKNIAGEFASKIVVQKRDAADNVLTQIMGDLLKIVGIEEGLITETTISTLQEQITQGLEDGWSMKEFQQAIIDTGVFSPQRALLIARTVATGAGNLGQKTGAKLAGATHKQWSTALFEVRDSHQKMEGRKVPIDEHFVVGGKKAMYPGDNSLPAAERCNCRCSCYYTIED